MIIKKIGLALVAAAAIAGAFHSTEAAATCDKNKTPVSTTSTNTLTCAGPADKGVGTAVRLSDQIRWDITVNLQAQGTSSNTTLLNSNGQVTGSGQTLCSISDSFIENPPVAATKRCTATCTTCVAKMRLLID